MDAIGDDHPGGNRLSGPVHGSVAQIVHNQGGVHIHQAAAPRAVPRCLPRRPAVLVDRRPVLARFEELRTADSPLIEVSGPGGVGKTALALHWLHSVADEYEDGHLYHDLGGGGGGGGGGGPVGPERVLPAFLRELGMPPERIPVEVEDQAAAYRSLLAGRRMLVFLDNVLTAGQIRHLLPGSDGCVVMVTSRRRLSGLWADGVRTVLLHPLDLDSAVELLSGTVDGEPEVLRGLAERCGRFPLALHILGGRLSGRPGRVARAAERLANAPRLDAFQAGEDLDVRANFEDSYRELDPESARLFRLLGLHPGRDMGLDAVAALADQPVDEAEDLLDLLVGWNLVAEADDGRFQMHDLLRDYARECAERDETGDGRDAALRRVLDFYLDGAAAADFTLGPGRWRLGPAYDGVRPLGGKQDAWEWLERERENLRAAVEAAYAREWDEHAWWLCEALWYLYFLRKHYRDWIDTHELGIRSAVRCGNGRAEARMRTQLGFALIGQDRADEAVREFTAARDAARSAGHREGEATAVESLGLVLLGRERWDEAAEALETNVRLAEETGDARAILLARHHLARAAGGAGDQDRAMELLDPLADAFLALDVPDPYNRGRVLTSLGQVQLRRGHPDTAINFFGQALEIMRAERATEQQADVWCHLADAARLRRDPDAERAALAEAHPLYESLGSPKAADVAGRLDGLRRGAR